MITSRKVIKLVEIIIICITLELACVVNTMPQEEVNKYNRTTYMKNDVCITPGCLKSATTVLSYMDPLIDPCDDFYEFACGGFVKKTHIPDDKVSVISFNIIGDLVTQQLRSIIEEPSKPEEPRPFRLLKQLYGLCMNESAIELDGLKATKKILSVLGGWPVLEGDSWNEEKFNWRNLMYQLRQKGYPTYYFMYLYVGSDTKNSSRRNINFDQATLGLDRENIVDGFSSDLVKAYYEYLVDVAVIFGADRKLALNDLEDAVNFEIQLAKITLAREDRRNLTALYNPMTVAEMQRRFSSIPWLEYINNVIGLPDFEITANEEVDVGVPSFIIKLESLLKETPKRVLANYVLSQIIIGQVSYLTKELRNRELKFEEASEGTLAMKLRWEECVETATKRMKLAAAALYVRKYFNEESKKKAAELVSDLRKAFLKILENVDWMDPRTKAKAIEKAVSMDAHIAYPSELLDDRKLEEYYSKFKPSLENYVGFNLGIRRFEGDGHFRRLRQPVNKTEWVKHSDATSVNAYYNMIENSIQLSAGILQGTFFDKERPNYMNYGAIGYAIGHEITHGFDDLGNQYDKDGQLINWWEEDTKKAFENKAQCIVDQYCQYTVPELHLKLNGITTQGENIADNGGIKEAYMAYNAWVKRNGEEPGLPGLNYTARQLFWISSANVWCTKERNAYLKQQILTDNHAPPHYRVLGAFSNSEDFANDFKCPLGSKMNPVNKCQVW